MHQGAFFEIRLRLISKTENPKGLTLISPPIVGGEYTLNDTLNPHADPSLLLTDEPPPDKLREFYQKIVTSIDKSLPD